jgi:hypothetical protein
VRFGIGQSLREARSALGLDLADAYPRQDIYSWRRHVVLDRSDGRVGITDTWDLAPDPDAAPTLRALRERGVTEDPGEGLE